MLIVLAAAGLIAILLLLVGLYGRRIDDHPVCRRCSFDLVGVYPAMTVCPECGADLAAHPRGRLIRRVGAVRLGQRRRRGMVVAIGVSALVVDGGATAALIWAAAHGHNVNKYMPAFWLDLQARRGSPASASEALKELLARHAKGTLDAARFTKLVGSAVALQADQKRPWLAGWGSLAEAAWSEGTLSPEQRASYARRCAPTELEVRDPVRIGDPIAVALSIKPRLGSQWLFYLSVDLQSAAIDGQPVSTMPFFRLRPIEGQAGGSGTSFAVESDPYEGQDSLLGNRPIAGDYTSSGIVVGPERFRTSIAGISTPGAHRLQTRWKLTIRDGAAIQGRMKARSPALAERPDDTVLSEWTEVLDTSFQIMPAGTESVVMVPDAALLPSIRKSVRSVVVQDLSFGGDPFLDVSVAIQGAPVDVAFRVLLRVGDREWPINSIAAAAGKEWHQVQSSARAPGFPASASAVDVILRADADVARKTVDLKRVWQGEIVIPNVAFRRRTINAADRQP